MGKSKHIYKMFIIFFIFFICLTMVYAVVKINAYINKFDCLFGRTIYIDAGHGGNDNGASVDTVLEDDINLKIATYLSESLIDSGAHVFFSRVNDYDLASMYQKNRKREDLNKRVKYINSIKPDIFISIHLNAFVHEEIRGGQVFFQNNENSKRLAEFVQNRFNILTGVQRKVKYGDYFILNNSNYFGIIVECGFLSNNMERNLLVKEEYQKKIADSIKVGVVDYFMHN